MNIEIVPEKKFRVMRSVKERLDAVKASGRARLEKLIERRIAKVKELDALDDAIATLKGELGDEEDDGE